MTSKFSVEELAIQTIRTLSIDAIEQANSGHPGLPLGAAAFAYKLWTDHLNHNPKNPQWFNRDRFILSAGHGSMLLYSLLHLSGYDLSLEELKKFRQWGSKTPGHPEYGHTPGVEATTGPLGQGIAMAVGMAMAERHLAATYNRENYPVVDHFTYALCGDGDLMEGVAAEAISLAGHLALGRLIVLYDSNQISLDGKLDKSFSEDSLKRFDAYGWQVLRVGDGNDLAAIGQAIATAKKDLTRPTLIEINTVIGFGSPNKAGSSAVHGSPLGQAETTLTKNAYGWTYDEPFTVPKSVYEHFGEKVLLRGSAQEKAWQALFEDYKEAYPELAEELSERIEGRLPKDYDELLPHYEAGKKIATRSASGEVMQALAKKIPALFGGSADLASSNKTMIKNGGDFQPFSYEGKNIWFGVREFAMGAALNGLMLHGGVKSYGATFFVFSDYLRPAVRLAALMGLPTTYVFTHDSIAVGEDGPTHEPVEQLAAFRAMPNLNVIRPADGNETRIAWQIALESEKTPTALVLSRQDLLVQPADSTAQEAGVRSGAYVLAGCDNPAALILASGSEVELAMAARDALIAENISVNVISFPSWHLFAKQPKEYKEKVLPPNVKARVAVEMGSSLGWERYTGDAGAIIAIDSFGASAPAETVLAEYGFTVERVVAAVKALL